MDELGWGSKVTPIKNGVEINVHHRGVDGIHPLPHAEPMNDITREEFNAKLETIEVKMDARVESVSTKIDGFLAVQVERDKRLDAVLAQISKDHGETKSSISSMKTTLIVTALTTVLAIVLGVASFNTALTANMMSAFQVGKGESAAGAAAQPTAKPASEPNAKPIGSVNEQK